MKTKQSTRVNRLYFSLMNQQKKLIGFLNKKAAIPDRGLNDY